MSLRLAPAGQAPVEITAPDLQALHYNALQDWCIDRLSQETRVATVLACQAAMLLNRPLRKQEIILLARSVGAEPVNVMPLLGYIPQADGLTYRDAFVMPGGGDARSRGPEEVASRALFALMANSAERLSALLAPGATAR